jgi:putative sigma-54 modulation protein
MQTDIQARGFPLTEALEHHIRTRLGFTLSRIASRIRRVNIRLSDLNGPRGGIDKRCLVEVRLDGLSVVVVEDVQSNMYTAIDRAPGRAARTTMRRLALQTNRRRQEAAHVLRHLSTGIG